MRLKREFEKATIDRVLQTAEALFATKGLEKASLRELTKRAGVNLAAVNYHFGSKDALTEAVFDRLSKRVNDRRLRDLERCLAEARAADRPPSLDDIIDSFVRPYLDPESDDHGSLLARLILQHRLSPSPLTKRIIRKHFDPMAKRYIEALAAACPNIPPAEFYWRYMFMVSTVVLTVTDQSRHNRIQRLSDGVADAAQPGALRQALLRFLKGGLAAD